MNLRYFATGPISHLVRELFYLSFTKEDLPFNSMIVPVGFTSLTYIYGKHDITCNKQLTMPLKGLTATGQFSSSYRMQVSEAGTSFGINFHPTGLYKLIGRDISKYTNKHRRFTIDDHALAKDLSDLFVRYESDWEQLAQAIVHLIKNTELKTDGKLAAIDRAIDLIESHEGMISVNDVLLELSFCQKTFETHFKRIVGITPGKFIRLHRFTKLMRRYESQEISIKDLIHMYDYYDRSHFAKDFKLYMNESPKQYFNQDYPLIREYLKNKQLR